MDEVVAGGGPTRILRRRENPRQTTFLELFFDLAIIFALTTVSRELLEDLTWFHFAETMLLLAAIFWVWIATAWSTDWFNPDEPVIQGLVLGVMLAGLLMTAAARNAFGPHAFLFAGAYAAIHVGRGILLIFVLRGNPAQRRTLRVAIWFALSGLLWLGGAFLAEPARLAVWALAIAVDYGVAWFGWPTPRLGFRNEEHLRVSGEHLSERYRQVFIIALGELVLTSGIAFTDAGFDTVRTGAFVIAFVNAVLLLWIYFVPAASRLSSAIDEGSPRTAVVAAYCHSVMIAGTVLTAAGNELLITRPLGEVRAAWSAVILGGTGVFLVGRMLVGRLIYGQRAWRALIALGVIAAVTPGMLRLPPLGVSISTTLILLVIVLSYGIPHRGR